MNFRAESSFRAGDWSRFEALVVPKLIAAATQAAKAVYDETQLRVNVDTGALKASGKYEVIWEGSRVVGYVSYGEGLPDDRAVYVEFGVGQRGAAGAWAGPYAYGPMAGFAGFGYLRGSLDTKRPEIRAAFQEQGFVI